MAKIKILLFLFLFANLALQAQTITGKIIESSTETPLEYANIVLLTLPDSTFITGTTSNEDGFFKFDNVNNGKYLLKISFVGFEDKHFSVEVSNTSVDLGEIQLEESNVLGEVVITSKAPPFQASVSGGIMANVSTTLLSSVGTASDVLQRMPGVMAQEGKITVFGKGAPIVYINNRKVRDASELERLESSEISTVELITNPSAKYDAEGRAVLLIKTKTRIDGFSAQITERPRVGKYLGDTENVSIGYTHGGLHLFATYYHNYGKQDVTEGHDFTFKDGDDVWTHNMLLPDYWNDNRTHQFSIGFDYSLDDNHAIGGQYQFYSSNGDSYIPISTSTLLNDAPYETSESQSNSEDNSHQHLVNAFYNGDFSDRFSVRLDFDYLKNYNHRDQLSDEIVNNTDANRVEIYNQTDYDLYAGKLTNSLKTGSGLIEFGGEYNNIAGSGYVLSNGATEDSEFTNTEQKAAAFASYSHKFGGVNVAAGLRYEYTSEYYTEGSGNDPVIDRTYSDWYPNFSVSGAIKNVDLSLAFNKRTQRPGFSLLNGNVIYLNRFVFQKGNPYLDKSNIYDLNMQVMLKPFYFNAGYTYMKNPVLFYFQQQEDNANSILSTYANFPKYETLYATLNFNHTIGFWQPNYTLGVERPFFEANYDGQQITYDKIGFFSRAYNDFTLPYDIVLSCNFLYQSDEQYAYFDSKGWQRFDAGLRKSFLNNTLRLNLMVYDIFDWVKEHTEIKIDNFNWIADKKNETRYATFTILWMFNNFSKKYRGESAAQDDINRF